MRRGNRNAARPGTTRRAAPASARSVSGTPPRPAATGGRDGFGKGQAGERTIEKAVLSTERIEAMLLDSALQDRRTVDVSKIAIALDGPPEGPSDWHIDRIERAGQGYSPGDFYGGQTPRTTAPTLRRGSPRGLDAVAALLREKLQGGGVNGGRRSRRPVSGSRNNNGRYSWRRSR